MGSLLNHSNTKNRERSYELLYIISIDIDENKISEDVKLKKIESCRLVNLASRL